MLSGGCDMSRKNAEQSVKNVLKTVADNNGVSVETVRHEIEVAIAAARENTDPNVRAFWNDLPCKGETPTPEEVIAYITGMGRGITH